MSSQQTLITTHNVETPSGRISYASAGSGPVALFVHGVVLNKHLWRHQWGQGRGRAQGRCWSRVPR